MRKKILALLVVSILIFAIAACADTPVVPESSDLETAQLDRPETENVQTVSLESGTVMVEGGLVSGVPRDESNIAVFKGIPYAAPPVDDLRWKAPQPVVPWEGVRECDTFSSICPQGLNTFGIYGKEFYSDGLPNTSEDCLYLNVWTPANFADEKLPVMMWIHGGGYSSGWSYEKEFDGEGFAEEGVILVTIDFRIGVFGYMAHPELSAESENNVSGNYGLLDQIAALQWIKNNIEAFGGDPDNVTVFGQSAGAFSVNSLISSPLSEGLINKAVMQSGGGIDPFEGLDIPLADAEKIGTEIASVLNANSIEELRNVSTQDLLNTMAQFSPKTVALKGFFYLIPNVDGYVLPDESSNIMASGGHDNIPYLLGTNKDDGFSNFRPAAIAFAEKQEELGRNPAYVYSFNRELPGDNAGAFHSAELWYVFQTLDRCWRPMTEADYALSDKISSYWANFAKTGDPNGEGLPQWNGYTSDIEFVMQFDVEE